MLLPADCYHHTRAVGRAGDTAGGILGDPDKRFQEQVQNVSVLGGVCCVLGKGFFPHILSVIKLRGKSRFPAPLDSRYQVSSYVLEEKVCGGFPEKHLV